MAVPSHGFVVYRATVTNTGTASAGVFAVVLTVDGVDQPAQRIGPLTPGARSTVSFQAKRCTPGTMVRVRADAAGEVPEAREGNNARQGICPAAG